MSAAPKCPNCARNYSFSQAGLQPRILSCQHSLCKQCVVRLVRVKKDGVVCPKCEVETPIPKGDKGLQSVPVNIFLVGLACTTVKQQINPFNHQLEFKAKPKDSKGATAELKGGRPPCVSCQLGPAECLCQQCNINLCNQCFITIHSNQAGKTHAKVSLLTDKVYGCTKHENMPREYFCQDDKEPICAKCGLMGEHKGHNVLHIQQKNSEVYNEVEPAMDSAKETLKKLYYGKEAADAEELRLTKKKEELIAKLEDKLVQYVADIQLKFHAVQDSVLAANDHQLENIRHIKNNLKTNICRLTTVMEDLQPGLQDKTKMPSNLMEVISILSGASKLPWYLAQGTEEEIEIPSDITDRVKVDTAHLHALKSSSELPEDFEEPKIDDSILKQNPLFGEKKPKKEKKKPTGPEHIRLLQREGILPADLTEVKHRVQPDPKIDLKKPNKKQFVRVVHIRNPACFYVHRHADQARLSKMMRSLTNICESIEDLTKHIPDPIQIGTKCCCKFDDGQWYRTMVRKIPDDVAGVLSMASPEDLVQADDKDDLKVEIVYIDYGNTQWVSVTKLVKLKPKFEKEPTFAVTCALYDIIPPEQKSTWPRESSEAFATMVATQDVPLVMSTHGDINEILQVDLHQSPNSSVVDDAPVSIRDALIFLELACFINDTPSDKTTKSLIQPRRYLPPELPCTGDSLGVTICNIIDPHHFWVHEMGVMESSLNKMMEELQDAYRARTRVDWAVLCPQIGMVCVAKYASDKKWYRAQILGLPGQQQVEVLYVDYGNTALVKASQIRKITEQFLKLPIMALPCKLVDVSPKVVDNGWDQDAELYFSQIISYKPVEIHIYNDQEDYMAVVAFDTSSEERVNLNALLVQAGHAVSSGPASFIPDMLRPSSGHSSGSKVKSPTSSRLPSHCEPASARKKEMYTAVHVSHVESPACIYLQLATANKDGLNSLLEAMTLHYKDSEADMDHEWNERDRCAALLAREGVWCRGEIMAFLPENNLVVLFTDYGNKEILALQNIRTLEESFEAEPPFAICCHLTRIIPAGGKEWTQTASQFLKDKLSDLDCYISQKGEKESDSLPVDLLYELTGQEMIDRNTDDELDSISELLIKEGLALRDRRKLTSKSKKTAKTDKKEPLEKAPTVVSKPSPSEELSAKDGDSSSPKKKGEVIGSPSPSKQTENSAINDSGDSGIVNPDHGTVALSPSQEGTSVDMVPLVPESGQTDDNVDKSVLQPPKDVTGKLDLTEELEQSANDLKEKSIVQKENGSVVDKEHVVGEAETVKKDTPEKSSRVMRNWVDQIDEEVECKEDIVQSPPTSKVLQPSAESIVLQSSPRPDVLQSPPTSDVFQSVSKTSPLQNSSTSSVLQSSTTPSALQTSPTTNAASNGDLSSPTSEKTEGGRGRAKSPKVPDPEPTEYLPPSLPDGEHFILAVSFVSQQGIICGLEVERLAVLQQMMDDLQVFCKKRLKPSRPLKVNEGVCAKFNLDNKWYRGTVTKIFAEAVEVVYIDFGNSEVVSIHDIDIRPFKADLPQQSMSCKLHEVTAISPEDSYILAQMVTEQTCSITIKEVCEVGKPIVVDMFLPTGENVAGLLIQEGLVRSTKSPPLPRDGRPADCDDCSEEIFDEDDDFLDSGECSKVSVNRDILREHAPTRYNSDQAVLHPQALLDDTDYYTPLPSRYRPLHFPLGWKEFLAEVPCIESPDLVYLQYSTTFRDGPYQDHDLMLLYEKFAALHAEVNKLALSLPEIIHPRQGLPCLAFYQSDRQWYRGEIISVLDGPVLYCNVRFVDYGTIERLPLDRICQLPEKYLELPTQCRVCKLEGLRAPDKIPPGFPVSENSNWPVASTNAMIQLIKNKIFLATILEDGPVPIISLYSCEFVNGGIRRGPPMFMSLIETGLADVGVGLNDYKRSESLSST